MAGLPSFEAADWIFLSLLLILIIINWTISGSVAAYFAIHQQLDDYDQRWDELKKERIFNLLKTPGRLLLSTQLAQSLLNITITVISIYMLNRLFLFSANIALDIFLKVLIVSIIIILFTDILPKRDALSNPTAFASKHIALIETVSRVMSPITKFLVDSKTVFSRSISNLKQEISKDDLSGVSGYLSDEINHDQEIDMLEGITRFKEKSVDDIQIPRSDIITINIQTAFAEVIKFIVDAGFSRIPVFEENPDDVKGILYVKDLLPHLGEADNFQWQSLIRPAYFVPGTKPIDDLLEEFRANKIHMAIVVDEYGGISGLITMEDILEEIVGDISDEYDEELPLYIMAPDGSYIFEGKTALEDFIKITNASEKDFEAMSDEVDTLAGLLLELKGDFPKRKEVFTYKKYKFQAEEMSKKRIVKIRYIPNVEKRDVENR